MAQQLRILGLTALILALLDLGVAGVLALSEGRGGAAAALARYFEYGRSVPGKLERWVERPEARDNMFDMAWTPTSVELSHDRFAQEDAAAGPVIRAYGMSFVAGILKAAETIDPDLRLDMHGGPAAPPNMVYDLFLQDRANRREGDIAVFGILSSSTPAMAAMSNRSWAFEQPAPFTYPVFWPDEAAASGLRRVAPLVTTAEDERDLIQNSPAKAAQWRQYLRTHDQIYTAVAFDVPALDASPLMRLIRRSLAIGAINRREAALKAGGFPYEVVLQRMIAEFARMARADGQTPYVFLIQSRDPADLDVLALARPVLEAQAIPYLATVEHANPRDPSAFVPDGHYTKAVNAVFGAALLRDLAARGF